MLRRQNYSGLVARNPSRTSNKNALRKITHFHHPPRRDSNSASFSPEAYRSDEEMPDYLWRILESSLSLIQLTWSIDDLPSARRSRSIEAYLPPSGR